mmetsp:Transcript_26918/g.58851  ORF Transcript_26918/g.58851 Transcript_26918/m.58851 type:complete len:760 (-) Transcript_26918:1747-4026(-)
MMGRTRRCRNNNSHSAAAAAAGSGGGTRHDMHLLRAVASRRPRPSSLSGTDNTSRSSVSPTRTSFLGTKMGLLALLLALSGSGSGSGGTHSHSCSAFSFAPSSFHRRSYALSSNAFTTTRETTATAASLISRRSSSSASGSSGRLFVSLEQTNQLFDIEDGDDDGGAGGKFHVTEQPASSFADIDYEDDQDGSGDVQFYDLHGGSSAAWEHDYDDDNDNDDDQAGHAAAERKSSLLADADAWNDYERDEDDILTEREDRLFLDEEGKPRETCILVGVEDLSAKRRINKAARQAGRELLPEEDQVYFTLQESMTEMRELIKTAGLELIGEVTQRLNEPNPRMYVGTGKVQEAMDMLQELGCCTVVFDAELSPRQQKALENSFNKKLLQNDFLGAEEGEIKVIDRTALILDIFAQHAKTREGKLQVDLALHEFRKPRLTRMWTHLERQSGAGGVGLRGPGESQLEIDKRLLRDRIIVLKKKIDDVQKQRDLHRKGRSNAGLPILSLVGYTNAGKSTLLNYLTSAGVMAENILFATLDPTTRKVKLPGHKTHPEVLLTDTVGFIQKLPTHLVAAFRATLEEVKEADVLVHVIDVSNPMWPKQANAVRTVLAEIGAGDKPMVQLLNKIDLLSAEDAAYCRKEMRNMENAVAVSSITGEGMEDFVAVAEEAMSQLLVPVEMVLPYSKGDELNIIHEVGAVDEVDYRETGTYIKGRVPKSVAMRLDEFRIDVDDAAPVMDKKTKQKASDDEWTAIGRGRHSATKN